jgi:hypothetical protein
MRTIMLLLLLFSLPCCGQSSKDSLRKHVVKLSEQAFSRSADHIEYLNRAADYIRENFLKYSKRVLFQKYEIDQVLFKNVIVSVGPDTGMRIIVGANYDAASNTPGADANASGVAGLIELSRLLSKIKNLPYRVDLVAYTLGDTRQVKMENTGSYIHAKSLKDFDIKVAGMLGLQGIGFFTDVPKTQRYPLSYYKWLYGNRGNFISLYLQQPSGFFPGQIKRMFKQYVKGIRVISFKPFFKLRKFAQGDHNNYIAMGYPAVKISNTGSFRNNYYHYDVDTYETLDYSRMSKVVNMIYETLIRYKQ